MSHHFAISCVVCSFRGASVIAAGRVRVGYVTKPYIHPLSYYRQYIVPANLLLFLTLILCCFAVTDYTRALICIICYYHTSYWLTLWYLFTIVTWCWSCLRHPEFTWGEETLLCGRKSCWARMSTSCKAGVVIVIASSQLHILHMHIVIYLLVLV